MDDDLKLVERLRNGALEAGHHGYDGTVLQEAADTITRLLKEQYEHSPEQKGERNIAIWRDWISGLNHIEIGDKYGVSNGRVGQIIKKITPLIIKYVNGPLNLKLFLYPSKHPHWAQDAISGMWWAQEAISGMWIESTIDEDLDEIFRFHFGDSKGRVVIQSRPK